MDAYRRRDAALTRAIPFPLQETFVRKPLSHTPARQAMTVVQPIDPGRRRLLASSLGAAAIAAIPLSATRAANGRSHTPSKRNIDMQSITTKDGTEIFYKDWGSGQPIVFHHGWPLSSDDWDAQMLFFL
ncbi:MAG: alpha/beta hydrolase, partial [Pseudoxanthomonas sp.]